MSISLLEVNNLQVSFRSEEGLTKAVDGISFTVNKGEITGIVGESGSGKSVTALSVMRLIPFPPGQITGGDIRYHCNDQAINLTALSEMEMRAYRGREISMIFQEPMTSLNPVYTCGSQVMEAILLHRKVDKKEAMGQTIELFRKVKLPDPEQAFHRYPHQLSGGQKQRVMIAMAMSCSPKLLIADEPTTALDVTVQKAILELLKELQEKEGMSIVFITHDLGVVAEIADQVLVMYKGKIVEQNKVAEIFQHPHHPYTKGLLACRPPLGKRLSRLPVISDFMEEVNGSVQEKQPGIGAAIESWTVNEEQTRRRLEQLQSQAPLLQLKGIKTWFPAKKNIFGRAKGWIKAVDGVSFEVMPGETLGLVGESGCGKTTLGRTILLLTEPMEGEIIYDGKDLRSLSPAAMREMRKDIQLIFQDPYSSLNPRLSVGSAIMEPLQVHGLYGNEKARKDKVMELLEKVNLKPAHFDRYPHEFSGGQR
ncbi:MAG TPA: ABC transporter ATP-binding protein, partial [Chitinophagaceae bacterium]